MAMQITRTSIGTAGGTRPGEPCESADPLAERKPRALPRPSWRADGDATRSAALERARATRERGQPRRRPRKGEAKAECIASLGDALIAPARWPLGQRSPESVFDPVERTLERSPAEVVVVRAALDSKGDRDVRTAGHADEPLWEPAGGVLADPVGGARRPPRRSP